MRIERAATLRRATSLAALVDVVFLLLLFFMLASTFSRFSVIEVGLGGSGQPAPVARVESILLSVDADGLLRVNGKAVSANDLAATLRNLASAGDRRILVRPTSRATAQDIVSALEIARSAAAGDVVLVR